MLWSQFSAILENFRRKYLKNHNIGPRLLDVTNDQGQPVKEVYQEPLGMLLVGNQRVQFETPEAHS
jgi:hypothetical protein